MESGTEISNLDSKNAWRHNGEQVLDRVKGIGQI